jgi:S1-C subfamily serine protease
MDEQGIREHIRNFAVCGLITGIVTSVFSVTHLYGFDLFSLTDAAIVLLLTAFVFFYKSRTASTLMVLYWIFNIFITMSSVSAIPSLIVKALFFFFFFMGMLATYRYHKDILHEKGILLSHMSRRVLAATIEIFFLPLIAYILIAFVPNKGLEVNTSIWRSGYFIFVIAFWLVSAIYILFKDAMGSGQSFAKRFLGLRVVDRNSRVKCRWWQSLVRNILFFIPFFQVAELIVVFTNSEHRRIGDFLARTIVVDTSEEFKPKPVPKRKTVEFVLKAVTGIMSAIFVLIIFFFVYHYAVDLDRSEKIRLSDDSVVMIWTYDEQNRVIGYGSGFFINSKGAVLTSRHVLTGAYKAYANYKTRDSVPVSSLIAQDVKYDLAVIQLATNETTYLKLGDSDKLKIGQDIYTIGSPIGLAGTVSKGIISQIRNVFGIILLQTDAPISPGSSGGPMLNNELEVVGINMAFMKEGQNLNFAVPINYAKGLLDRSKVVYYK